MAMMNTSARHRISGTLRQLILNFVPASICHPLSMPRSLIYHELLPRSRL
jgi:hypothetical protein